MRRQILSVAAFNFFRLPASTTVFASELRHPINTTALWFESWGALSNAALTIFDPKICGMITKKEGIIEE
jgi:hypothetical protein